MKRSLSSFVPDDAKKMKLITPDILEEMEAEQEKPDAKPTGQRGGKLTSSGPETPPPDGESPMHLVPQDSCAGCPEVPLWPNCKGPCPSCGPRKVRK